MSELEPMGAAVDRRLQLLHFDIKTLGNYGDTLLFECVRQVFEGAMGGATFEVGSTWPLRHRVGPSLIDRLNESFDAAVIGGGGLFLRDTNENPRSGWQWDISTEQLERMKSPLIVFAVGYNRFIGQPDFEPVFRRHLDLVVRKSIFVGLRNSGSVDALSGYLDESLRGRLVVQPCPTVHVDRLFPDLVGQIDPDERRLAVQLSVGPRERAGGLAVEEVEGATFRALSRLARDGWTIDAVSHVPADRTFADELVRSGCAQRRVVLPVRTDPLYGGVRYYGTTPFALGNRGHVQMVSFGAGTVPASIATHPKLGFFAHDVGHDEWCVEPRADTYEDDLYRRIHELYEQRSEQRASMALARERLWLSTQSNLAQIARTLGVDALEGSFVPYTIRERHLAERSFLDSRDRWRAERRSKSSAKELVVFERRLATKGRSVRSLRRKLDRTQAALADSRAQLAATRSERDRARAELARSPTRRLRRLARRTYRKFRWTRKGPGG